jgi:hypothetical protein
LKEQLKILKKFFANHEIKNTIELKLHITKYNICFDIVKNENIKRFTINSLIKLFNSNEEKLFCKCGAKLRYYNSSKKEFETRCKLCKDYVSSETIKKTRLIEKQYFGDYYDKQNTINFLKNENFEKFLHSGAQRKFIKEKPKLYFSILKHTKNIDKLKGINIRARLYFLLNRNSAYCKCGEIVKLFDNNSKEFFKVCKSCVPKKNSLEYYKLFYPHTYIEKYKADREKRRRVSKGLFTLKWFIGKYGEKEGKEKYDIHITRLLSKRATNIYSKISLNLFNNILLYGYDTAKFGTHPREVIFNLNDKYSKLLKQGRIFVDFVYEKKIIEFQGNYWHNKTKHKDNLKKDFLKSIGYDVLFIYENEYKEDNLRELNKCLKFLKDISIQNRYNILTESGYKNFDNIIKLPKTKTLLFTLEDESTIEVSKNHLFYKNKKEYKSNELKINDTIKTKTGLKKITHIKQSTSEVFEVLETEDHTYYANNILNHNCKFLGSSHTLINSDKLQSMSKGEIHEIRDGKLNIFEYPKENHKYIMTVDPAKDGVDAFAVQIVDITDYRFKQVASAQLQIDYLLMPEFINEWGEFYNKAYLIIENNEGAGQSIADQMYQNFEYENLHFDKIFNTVVSRTRKKKYPGFRSTTKTRKQIIQTLKLFIENDKLDISCKATIDEFYQFILIKNKFQADLGAHDDMIISLALVFVPFCNTKNFEDMRKLVKNLYDDYIPDDEKVKFVDILTIGNFDDGTDVEPSNALENWNGYDVEDGGFI